MPTRKKSDIGAISRDARRKKQQRRKEREILNFYYNLGSHFLATDSDLNDPYNVVKDIKKESHTTQHSSDKPPPNFEEVKIETDYCQSEQNSHIDVFTETSRAQITQDLPPTILKHVHIKQEFDVETEDTTQRPQQTEDKHILPVYFESVNIKQEFNEGLEYT